MVFNWLLIIQALAYVVASLLLIRKYNRYFKDAFSSSEQSRLDWTIVRPGAFTDGERTGQYRHGFPGTDNTTKLKISRADVADFMLKQLVDDTYLHKTPGLSY